MQVGAGRTQLYTAMKTCLEHWEQTKPAWRDAVCRDFEENSFEPLKLQVSMVLHAIDRLSGVLEQMHRECE